MRFRWGGKIVYADLQSQLPTLISYVKKWKPELSEREIRDFIIDVNKRFDISGKEANYTQLVLRSIKNNPSWYSQPERVRYLLTAFLRMKRRAKSTNIVKDIRGRECVTSDVMRDKVKEWFGSINESKITLDEIDNFIKQMRSPKGLAPKGEVLYMDDTYIIFMCSTPEQVVESTWYLPWAKGNDDIKLCTRYVNWRDKPPYYYANKSLQKGVFEKGNEKIGVRRMYRVFKDDAVLLSISGIPGFYEIVDDENNLQDLTEDKWSEVRELLLQHVPEFRQLGIKALIPYYMVAEAVRRADIDKLRHYHDLGVKFSTKIQMYDTPHAVVTKYVCEKGEFIFPPLDVLYKLPSKTPDQALNALKVLVEEFGVEPPKGGEGKPSLLDVLVSRSGDYYVTPEIVDYLISQGVQVSPQTEKKIENIRKGKGVEVAPSGKATPPTKQRKPQQEEDEEEVEEEELGGQDKNKKGKTTTGRTKWAWYRNPRLRLLVLGALTARLRGEIPWVRKLRLQWTQQDAEKFIDTVEDALQISTLPSVNDIRIVLKSALENEKVLRLSPQDVRNLLEFYHTHSEFFSKLGNLPSLVDIGKIMVEKGREVLDREIGEVLYLGPTYAVVLVTDVDKVMRATSSLSEISFGPRKKEDTAICLRRQPYAGEWLKRSNWSLHGKNGMIMVFKQFNLHVVLAGPQGNGEVRNETNQFINLITDPKYQEVFDILTQKCGIPPSSLLPRMWVVVDLYLGNIDALHKYKEIGVKFDKGLIVHVPYTKHPLVDNPEIFQSGSEMRHVLFLIPFVEGATNSLEVIDFLASEGGVDFASLQIKGLSVIDIILLSLLSKRIKKVKSLYFDYTFALNADHIEKLLSLGVGYNNCLQYIDEMRKLGGEWERIANLLSSSPPPPPPPPAGGEVERGKKNKRGVEEAVEENEGGIEEENEEEEGERVRKISKRRIREHIKVKNHSLRPDALAREKIIHRLINEIPSDYFQYVSEVVLLPKVKSLPYENNVAKCKFSTEQILISDEVPTSDLPFAFWHELGHLINRDLAGNSVAELSATRFAEGLIAKAYSILYYNQGLLGKA